MDAMKVLMVGSGGIGCELLKTLALSPSNLISEITLVDLDTIDLSNLNRQFLFRRQHIGKSKCKVAAEAIMKLKPPFKITPYHANIITDQRFDLDWFKQFDIVMNALDNLEARRHVNRMCLATGKPLIESGTAGLLGQATVHVKGETECYDCLPHSKPKVYPVCTIRSTPSKPIHCVVWSKSYLFNQLFGAGDEDESETVEEASADLEELAKLRKEAQALKELREKAGSESYAQLVFEKIFNVDINRLLTDEEMWKDRHKPEPLKFEELEAMPEEQTELDGVSRDHTVWSLQKTFTVFCQSCLKLGERVKEKAELEFEKDDDEIMDFITAATNLRAHIFGIKPLQSRFQIKEMAGNIIPAIATTNAVIAGFMTLNVVRLTQNLKQQKERLSHGIKTAYLTNNTNGTRLVNAEQLQPPNKECGVCQLEYRQVTANASEATLGGLLETVLRSKLQMLGDLQILRSDGSLLYDFDFEDNLESTLEQLQIGKGGYLTVVDEENPNGDRQTVTLYVKHSTEITEFSVDPDCELSLKPQVKQATGKRKAEDEADGEPAAKELKTETIVVVEDDVIVVE